MPFSDSAQAGFIATHGTTSVVCSGTRAELAWKSACEGCPEWVFNLSGTGVQFTPEYPGALNLRKT